MSDPYAARRLPPLSTAPPTPASALRSLLHTRLAIALEDGRTLTGNLLAVDDSASLLLSLVRETRVLGDTPQGHNVARYYPFSREETAGWGEVARQEDQQLGDLTRVRDLASVLVPIKHVREVRIADDNDAHMWAQYAAVEIRDGVAVPGTSRPETDKMRVGVVTSTPDQSLCECRHNRAHLTLSGGHRDMKRPHISCFCSRSTVGSPQRQPCPSV